QVQVRVAGKEAKTLWAEQGSDFNCDRVIGGGDFEVVLGERSLQSGERFDAVFAPRQCRLAAASRHDEPAVERIGLIEPAEPVDKAGQLERFTIAGGHNADHAAHRLATAGIDEAQANLARVAARFADEGAGGEDEPGADGDDWFAHRRASLGYRSAVTAHR